MPGVFDFVPNSHVAEEIAPDEQSVTTMNGWDFVSKPRTPYKAKFRLTLSGMRWRLNSSGNALNTTTGPADNAGRLLAFYKLNRMHGTFTYTHEYLGSITVRFAEPVNIPKALPNSGGLIEDFQVMLIHHNPGWV